METIGEFSRLGEQLKPEAPLPFKQDQKLKAAIDQLFRSQDNTHISNTPESCVLPRKKMDFNEVSQIIQEHLHPEVAGTDISTIEPKDIVQETLKKRRDIIAKIEDILANVNKTAEDGKIPKLLIRNQRLWSNCIYDFDRVTLKSNALAKKSVVTYSATGDRFRFNAIIFVLTIVRDMLTKNMTCTRRELYYQNVTRLRSQSTLDAAVRDVCCLLDTPPWTIGVTATAKGLVAGPLTIVTKDGIKVDCMAAGGTIIPQDVVGIQSLKSTAKYILVLEKDAIFQKLLDEGVLERLAPVIVITGKGYPDVCTRQLLRRLTTDLRLPALALVDADPHGLEIFLTYKYGSLAQSHLSSSLACGRLALLGVRGRDVRALAPVAARMPLTALDTRKLKSLLARPYLNTPQSAGLAQEARTMLEGGCKAELESVAALAAAYLTETYLPAGLRAGDFLL